MENFLFLEPDQIILSSTLHLIKCFWIFQRKASVSNIKSWNCLEKQGCQWPRFPFCSHISATNESFELVMENKVVKDSFCNVSPHHLSNQNLILLPFSTTKQILLLKTSQFFLIAFQKSTPYPSLDTPKLQPPPSFPNFPTITSFHKDSLSKANCHPYLPKSTMLRTKRFLIPKPPFFLFKHTLAWFTRWSFFSRAPPPHKKFLCIFANLKLTFLGITNKAMQ